MSQNQDWNGKVPSATEQFGMAVVLLEWGLYSLAVFWVYTMRKFGTIGTRTYAFPWVGCMCIIAVLGSGSVEPDYSSFHIAGIWLVLAWFLHSGATTRRRRKGIHVHSRHIGEPRFGHGTSGYMIEFFIGLCAGGVMLTIEATNFGLFVMASAFAAVLTVGMIEERDKQRAYLIKDAILEQQRMGQYGFGNQNGF